MTWVIPALNGRSVLVTGGNSGIGLETARVMAAHGADVAITARNAARGAAAAAAIRAEWPDANIRVLELDLADLGSVRKCAESVGALDILVNNAGVMALPSRHLTRGGFELQFGTNHLGHFALTGLLLPVLRASTTARIVSVSSLAHRRGALHFDDLQFAKSYRPWRAYTQSKLANLMFALELQRRLTLHGESIVSIAAHPGVAATNLAVAGPTLGQTGIVPAVTRLIFNIVGQSAAGGALPIVFAATAPGLAGGNYIGPSGWREMRGPPAPAWIAPQAQDTEAAARLWTLSEQLTGIEYLDHR